MDDETRAQYEGFRPGVYVRVEVRLVYVIPFTLFSYYSLSLCSAEALMEVPSGANSRPPCASTGPVPRYGGGKAGWGGSGLISFAAYSWNRILGLQVLGWYRAYVEIRAPWGRRSQWPRNLICWALTDWDRGTVPVISQTSLLLT